jgi:aspartyl protease
LNLSLQTATAALNCYAIVDSGADDCVFPASFASQLGLDLSRNTRTFRFGGVGSSNQVAYFFDLNVTFEQVVSYKMSVGFSPALEAVGIGLLGQNGFFENFRVTFDLSGGFFTLDPR